MLNAIQRKGVAACVNAAQIACDFGPEILIKDWAKMVTNHGNDSSYDYLCTAKVAEYGIPHTGNKMCSLYMGP